MPVPADYAGMGLFERLTGGDPDDSDEWSPGDHGWRVSHSDPDHGGWSAVEDFSGLQAPVTEEQFRLNTGDLDPGTYKLFAIQERPSGAVMQRSPPDDIAWGITVDREKPEPDPDPEPRTDTDDELDEVKQTLNRLTQHVEDDTDSTGTMDPDKMLEQAQAQLAIQALNSEEFVTAYGDKIALSAFGGLDSGGMSVDYDTFEENPIGAAMYQAMEDPDKMGDLGGALGKAAGEFAQGMTRTFDMGDAIGSDDRDEPQPQPTDTDTDTEDTPPEPPDVSDPGPSSFGDLDMETPSPEETAEEMAEARTAAEQTESADPDTMATGPETAESGTETTESTPEPDTTPGDEYAPTEPLSAAPVENGDSGDPYDSMDPDDPPGGGVDGTGDDAGSVSPNGDRPQCQATTSDGDQCSNPAETGSRYCYVEAHGPDAGGDDAGDAESAAAASEDAPASTAAAGSSDPEAIAEDL